MRKILVSIALILAFSSFSEYYATTWAGTSSNQAVTFYAAADAISNGVFSATGTSITGSYKLMTKSEAATYLSINTSYAAYAAKSSGQLVVKSDLQSAGTPAVAGVYTHPSYGSIGNSGNVSTDCSNLFAGSASGNLYSYSSAGDNPADGIVMYQINSSGTLSAPVSANYTGWNGVKWRSATKVMFHTNGSSGMSTTTTCP